MRELDVRLSRLLGCGTLRFQPFVVLTSGRLLPDGCRVREAPGSGVMQVSLTYGDRLREEFFFRLDDGQTLCRRATENIGHDPLDLVETGFACEGIRFADDPARDYFYHVENPRIYGRFAMPVDARRGEQALTDAGFDVIAGTRWADPGVAGERIGASPYQPFPAILLANHAASIGLVHGTLTQEVFHHNYLLSRQDGAIRLDLRAAFKAIGYLRLAPGRVLNDAWYLGRTDEAGDIERLFAGYLQQLRAHLPPLWGATAINRHSLVWGSWNDGIRRDIDQERLLRTAAFLKAHFPTVGWMQIDDGYARLATDLQTAHGLGMPYEGEAGVAREKFPDGLRAFADRVRASGIRPAVWIGGLVPHETPLYREHPDWFFNYDYRTPGRSPLDVSKPEVRAYIVRALDYYLNVSGFEGMKHDFWSYAFEDSHDLLAEKHASGYEWRAWWLRTIRARLPADGYLQTGCDIVMGNPFLGQYFTNYRYGIDIGSGNWEHVKTNFLWGTACFALHIGDLIVPNSDSVGLFPDLTDEEALLCINFCLISRSMVEIAGWLHEADPRQPRFQALRKAICCPNNGQEVFFAGYDYRTSDEPPAVWYLKTPHFSLLADSAALPLRTVAFFNIGEAARDFTLAPAQVGLPPGRYRVSDVWHGGSDAFTESLTRRLPPHGSLLLAITADGGDQPRILDADLKIDAVQMKAGALRVIFGHAGDFTLTVSHPPLRVAGVSGAGVTAGRGEWRVSGTATPGAALELAFA